MKINLNRIAIVLNVTVILVIAFLAYDYQVLWTMSTCYILVALLVIPTLGSIIALYFFIKKKKLKLSYLIVLVSIFIVSFSFWVLFHYGPPNSIFASRENLHTENQIIKRVIYYLFSGSATETNNRLVVHPMEKYGWNEKDELEMQFNKYSSLIDQFYEINNPCDLTLQSSPGDFYSIYDDTIPISDLETDPHIGVSSPAFDLKSGYLIVYTGSEYSGYLNVFRYKLGKLIFIETLDSWCY